MIKMCQITCVGSCHFDAIQTKDACLSCADGGIVSAFNAVFTDWLLDVRLNMLLFLKMNDVLKTQRCPM